MRYQYIDTLTGEVVQQSKSHPLFAPLRYVPKRQPQIKHTKYKAAGSGLTYAAGVALLALASYFFGTWQ
jgi:hypothetical protein